MATSRTGARGRVAQSIVSSEIRDGAYIVNAPEAPATAQAARFACAQHAHVGRDGRNGYSANGMFGESGHLVLRHGMTPEAAAAARPA